MKAIVTVLGPDKVGIIAQVCSLLASKNANIIDISQTVMQEYITMTMIVSIGELNGTFDELREALDAKGKEMGLLIRIQNEEIFNAMHRI